MIGVTEAFAPSYARARVQFLEAAATAGLSIESHPHPLPGHEGEALALDVVRDGPPDADRLLVVSSGCHGADGFCGSGVQVFALHDAQWCAKARDAGVATLYLHALNPYGFSHLRSTTHENVDLSRNFVDFSQPLPVNAAYREIAHLLIPPTWPPDASHQAALEQIIAHRSRVALLATLSRGQHEFAQGLFFGGMAPTWSHRTLRQVLRQHGGRATRMGWMDLHAGQGANGQGERIFAGGDDAAAAARARQWWGGAGTTPLASIHDGTFAPAFLAERMCCALRDECPQAEITGITLQFGTESALEVLQALRAEQWLHLHPEAPPMLADQIRAQIRAAFYDDTDAWKGQVISQARQALFQAVDGLIS